MPPPWEGGGSCGPGGRLPSDGHGRVFEATAALATIAAPLATADFYSSQSADRSAATAAVAMLP